MAAQPKLFLALLAAVGAGRLPMLDPALGGALVEMEVGLPAQSGDGDPVDLNSGRHVRGTYCVTISATEAGARLPVLLPAHTHLHTHTQTPTRTHAAQNTRTRTPTHPHPRCACFALCALRCVLLSLRDSRAACFALRALRRVLCAARFARRALRVETRSGAVRLAVLPLQGPRGSSVWN